MGQVINIPEAGMDYVLYGDNRAIVGNYLYSQLQQLPNTLTEFGAKVYNTLHDSYNYITDKFTQQNIINSLADQNVNISNSMIFELMTFDSLQTANLTMQRYIMANPVIREKYINQECDGYSNSYKNIFGKTMLKDNYDYRRVTNGIATDIDNGTGFEVNYYHEDLYPGDKELEFHEQVKILNSWDASNWLIENCKFDFTCQVGSENKYG